MKYLERVENLNNNKKIKLESYNALINIYNKATKEKQKELNNLDEKGFNRLLEIMKIIDTKNTSADYTSADYFKDNKWFPIGVYIISYALFTLLMADGDNIEEKMGVSFAFHLLVTIAVIPMCISILMNYFRPWFSALTIILVLFTWILGYGVYYYI